MTTSKQKVWQQILTSTNDMAEVAQRNDWELLEELVQHRKKLLSDFFSEPVAKDRHLALEQIRNDISLILIQDRNTKKSCLSNKGSILGGLQTLQKGKSAVKMYS
ncbi:MAG: flagellar protein FliT [Pseudohongiellaceae bacterium]